MVMKPNKLYTQGRPNGGEGGKKKDLSLLEFLNTHLIDIFLT